MCVDGFYLADGVEVGTAFGDLGCDVSEEVDVAASSGCRSSRAASDGGYETAVWSEKDDYAVGFAEVSGANDDAFGVEVSSSG